MKSNWILNVNDHPHECTSFPCAFRLAYNMVRKQIEAGKPTADLIGSLSITGPPTAKNERNKYSYASATDMAIGMGLLTPDGQINSKEFKGGRR